MRNHEVLGRAHPFVLKHREMVDQKQTSGNGRRERASHERENVANDCSIHGAAEGECCKLLRMKKNKIEENQLLRRRINC
eukprot:3285074-Pleurochrysis_carterae.AAC.2